MTSTNTDVGAEELTVGIANAIKAHDFEAVRDMIHALAFIDPQRAQDIYDILTMRREGGLSQ